MFESINKRFYSERNRAKDDEMIVESVVEDEALIEDDDDDDIVDSDSLPAEIVTEVDKALDKVVERPDFDDVEVEELLDDDDDDDESINATIDECAQALVEGKTCLNEKGCKDKDKNDDDDDEDDDDEDDD